MKNRFAAFIIVPILLCGMLFGLPAHAEGGRDQLRWYFKKAEQGIVPPLPVEFSDLSEHGGVFLDTGHPGEKRLYLTFDAGYENGNVAKVLDVLGEKGVRGSFFILSHLVRANTPLVLRMFEEGHLVCNHTAHHKNMAALADSARVEEIKSLEETVLQLTGHKVAPYFRPPEGTFSREMLDTVKRLGYTTVFWSFAYADWANDRQPDPEKAICNLLSHTHPGEILLLHPTSTTNATILGRLIDEWRGMGYSFHTLDEL